VTGSAKTGSCSLSDCMHLTIHCDTCEYGEIWSPYTLNIVLFLGEILHQ